MKDTDKLLEGLLSDNLDVDSSDLEVDISSMYNLEQDIVLYSRKLSIFGKLLAQATSDVANAELDFEVLSAELVKEIREKEKIPPSALQEVRRTIIVGDPRYKAAKRNVINKTEIMNIARSAYYAMTYKNDRLKEAFRIGMKVLQSENPAMINEEFIEKQKSYESYSESMNNKINNTKTEVD